MSLLRRATLQSQHKVERTCQYSLGKVSRVDIDIVAFCGAYSQFLFQKDLSRLFKSSCKKRYLRIYNLVNGHIACADMLSGVVLNGRGVYVMVGTASKGCSLSVSVSFPRFPVRRHRNTASITSSFSRKSIAKSTAYSLVHTPSRRYKFCYYFT